MYKLKYLEQAREDFLKIKRYIAKESGNKGIALSYTEKLRQQCRKLAQISGTVGMHRPELAEGLRSFPYGNYVIFFRYNEEFLEVVTIVEGHRDMTPLFH